MNVKTRNGHTVLFLPAAFCTLMHPFSPKHILRKDWTTEQRKMFRRSVYGLKNIFRMGVDGRISHVRVSYSFANYTGLTVDIATHDGRDVSATGIMDNRSLSEFVSRVLSSPASAAPGQGSRLPPDASQVCGNQSRAAELIAAPRLASDVRPSPQISFRSQKATAVDKTKKSSRPPADYDPWEDPMISDSQILAQNLQDFLKEDQ